jgi:diaminopimelate epimerase
MTAPPLNFVKVEGAGNDFILVDGRAGPAGWNAARIQALCDRRRGIGADGLLYLEPAGAGLPQVRFWNRDGRQAAFCGNGARAVAAYLLAQDGSAKPAFRLGGFDVEAASTGAGRFRTTMPHPSGEEVETPSLSAALAAGGDQRAAIHRAARVTVGVPHLVLWVCAELFRRPAADWGPRLSRHPAAGPERANINLIRTGKGAWRLRTFERGVEEETLACGSGITAAAWALIAWGQASAPVVIRPTGNDSLTVDRDAGGAHWSLEGPARIVYRGVVEEGGNDYV